MKYFYIFFVIFSLSFNSNSFDLKDSDEFQIDNIYEKTKDFNSLSEKQDDIIDTIILINNNLNSQYYQNYLNNNQIFDLVDLAIRKAYIFPDFYNMFKEKLPKNNFFNLNLDHLLCKYSYFYRLVDKNSEKYISARNSKIVVESDLDDLAENSKLLNVFHAAFESNNLRIGGVGPYIAGLVKNENLATDEAGRRLMNASCITPCYDVLVDRLFGDLKFVGIIPHEIEGVCYHSTIYEYFDPKINATQYLVKADPYYFNGKLYQINNPKNLYNHFSNEMWIYFSSAIASFSASFKGSYDHPSNVDILQINDWHLGLTTPLIDTIYNFAREEAGLPKIKTIATTHELNQHQGQDGSYLYTMVGLVQPESRMINLQATFNLHADMSNTVSKSVADEMRHFQTGFGLDHIFQHRHEIGRFKGITNGIDLSEYNVFNKEILGKFRVNSEKLKILKKKQKAKKFLYDNGIIEDVEKTLLLYVGRFSEEKGVDIFDALIQETLYQDAQVVIMGQSVNSEMTLYVESLQRKYFDNPNVKIFDNVQRDQLESLNGTNIQKGKLIRFAADITIIPSIEEACGLVPIEALAMGSLVFSSHVHGLKDLIIPFPTKENLFKINDLKNPVYTGCTFERHLDFDKTKYDFQKRLSEILVQWKEAEWNVKERIMRHLIEDARKFEWLTPESGVFSYYQMYLDSMNSYNEKDLLKIEEFNRIYFSE